MYTYSPTSEYHIERHYYDIVGEKELKNGIAFVIHAYLPRKLFLQSFNRSLIYIFGEMEGHITSRLAQI